LKEKKNRGRLSKYSKNLLLKEQGKITCQTRERNSSIGLG